MLPILIATNNSDKFFEISQLFKASAENAIPTKLTDFNLVFAGDLIAKNNIGEPVENGDSFAANSLIKAKYYAESFCLNAVADDSGFVIPEIGDLPGVNSARFAIDATGKTNYPLAFEKIQNIIAESHNDLPGADSKTVNKNNNTAISCYFICNLTFYNYNNKSHFSFEGRVDGFLSFPPRGGNGFGYDPIFVPNIFSNGSKLTFGEISSKQKNSISHRSLAFSKLKKFLESYNY
jgi:XTP/dITP diphosphohydrolase